MPDPNINAFGITSFRGQKKKFGIKTDDRRRHMYVIGKTGSGKTTLLAHMAINDILAGNGLGVIDPHGEFVEDLLNYIPENRIDDVIYFNPADINNPIAFNPLEHVDLDKRHLVASGIMGVFKKIWPDVWSARMEYILSNSLLALLEYPGSTLLGIIRLLNDKDYRKEVVLHLADPVVKGFWINEFSKYTQKFEVEATAAILNKVGQFVSNPLIRNIIGQVKSTIDMRDIMDNKKIFLVNLAKGRVGEDNSALLGAMLITKLQLAAMSRVDIHEADRKDFFLYVDEFQNFATESFAAILSEARKYRLDLILAHQYIEQLEEEVQAAIFGNIGTMITFRIGATDAEVLEKEFLPDFSSSDLINLAKYNMYVKLMIDGLASQPFSAVTMEPRPKPAISFRDVIIERNRLRYTLAKTKIDQLISDDMLKQEKTSQASAAPKTESPAPRTYTKYSAPVRQSSSPSSSATSSFVQREYPKKEVYQERPAPRSDGSLARTLSQYEPPVKKTTYIKKEYPKKDVDIEALKKSIGESLKKGED